jgi:hypothetical protein
MGFHFGSWSPNGLPKFQRAVSRIKLIGLKNSLYHWEALGIHMFKMGSHVPFEYLKHKLWLKERLEVRVQV